MRAVSSLLAICAICACVLSVITGCVSPGTPYTYLDVKFGQLPTLAPTQPATNQSTTVSFAIRNTFNAPLTNVDYIVYQNTTSSPTSGSVFVAQTTIASIPAFGSAPVTFTIPAQAAGNYTFSVSLDPSNTIAERDETNNIATFTEVVADADVTFGAPTPSIDTPAPTPAPLTLHFAITNIANTGATAPPTAHVSYLVYLDSNMTTPVTLTSPTPASPVTVAPGVTVAVTASLPRPGIGTHSYTIVLTSDITESNTSNNIAVVFVPVPN